MVSSEQDPHRLFAISLCGRQTIDCFLDLVEEPVVVLQFRVSVVGQLPIKPCTDRLPVSTVAIIDNGLCFECEISVLLPQSKVECEGDVRRWRESKVSALVTVDLPSRISPMPSAARRKRSVALLVQKSNNLSNCRVYPAKVSLRLQNFPVGPLELT